MYLRVCMYDLAHVGARCVRACVRACVRVCVCERARAHSARVWWAYLGVESVVMDN